MARILVRNAQRHRAERSCQTEFVEKLRNVFHLSREFLRRLMRRVAFLEEFGIFLERGSAACGIGNDGVEVRGWKNFLVRARQIASDVPDSGVRGQRATADLIARYDDFTAIGLQDANRGSIEFTERDLRNTARKKRDARAARPLGRKRLAQFREKEMRIDLRHQALAFLQAQEPQDSSSTCKRSQAA